MSAPEGNKNAEKWTFEKSQGLLQRIIVAADDQDDYLVGNGQNAMSVRGYKFDFIGEITLHFGVYHELITRDIPRRFPELKEESDLIIRLMERNCYSNVKRGIINTAAGIINLKSNHKWKDRIDATTEDKQITTPVIINWNGDKANTETSGGSQDS